MRAFLAWLAVLGVLALGGFIVFELWNLDWRWRPHTIDKHQAMIAQSLDQSGWVSPHLTGPKLYVIAYRDCPACIDFETREFPKLQAVGIDTRVIMIARADLNGQSRSTPAERATVAELWTNRSWKLFQQWSAAPAAAWTAPGVSPADGDAARTAVVETGRTLVDDLTPLLKDDGIRFGYPTLVWWTKDGKMRGCVCDRPQTYKAVEKELGA
jgi:hypothetical protein